MEELKLETIIKAIEDKKGEDIVLIDVSEKTPFASYYVLVTISSSRKAEGIINGIDESLKNINQEIRNVEGSKESEWILVDCDDVIVHLLTPAERNRIDFEKLLEGAKKTRIKEEGK